MKGQLTNIGLPFLFIKFVLRKNINLMASISMASKTRFILLEIVEVF